MTSLPSLSEVERSALNSMRKQHKSMTSKEAMGKAKEVGKLIEKASEADKPQLSQKKVAYIAYSFLLEREESEIAGALVRIKEGLERSRNKKP